MKGENNEEFILEKKDNVKFAVQGNVICHMNLTTKHVNDFDIRVLDRDERTNELMMNNIKGNRYIKE